MLYFIFLNSRYSCYWPRTKPANKALGVEREATMATKQQWSILFLPLSSYMYPFP